MIFPFYSIKICHYLGKFKLNLIVIINLLISCQNMHLPKHSKDCNLIVGYLQIIYHIFFIVKIAICNMIKLSMEEIFIIVFVSKSIINIFLLYCLLVYCTLIWENSCYFLFLYMIYIVTFKSKCESQFLLCWNENKIMNKMLITSILSYPVLSELWDHILEVKIWLIWYDIKISFYKKQFYSKFLLFVVIVCKLLICWSNVAF